MKKEYVRYEPSTKEIIITGIPVNRLMNRINETYRAGSGYEPVSKNVITNIFNSINWIRWDEAEIIFFSYFSLEVYQILIQLAETYKDYLYADVADELYHKSWIGNYENNEKVSTDLYPLTAFNIQPKDFQLEFIKNYSSLKFAYDLDGYILSFEQGLGKTFTSIALAECLHKKRVYIICPNAIKENWAYEIKSYFKKYNNNESLWHDEVYVSGISRYKFSKLTKYIIINQESIPNIYQYVDKDRSSMIIVDESHNFRGLHTKRTDALLKLKELTNCADCLLMSGTPIKATANELAPAMRMIDPHFTEPLAEIYTKAFASGSPAASDVVKARFKRVIYRKLKKETLKLPEKYINDIRVTVPLPEQFSTTKIKNEILDLFHKEYTSRLISGLFTNNKSSIYYRSSSGSYKFSEASRDFEKIVRKYSRAHPDSTERYLRMVFQDSIDANWELITAQNVENKYFNFLLKYVTPYITDKKEKEIVTTKFDGIFGWAIAAKSSAGMVIGKTLAKYKNQCFTQMWKYNSQEFINMILRNEKKTVIFTALVPTADYIYSSLKENKVGCVEITGNTPGNRMKLVKTFKEDNNTKVLVATTETLGNGITLTEADQILFFGTPYRSADFEQACDRIHRIGQTSNCHIYNILLKSQDKNITDRIQEIMGWSEEMFDSLMLESQNL